MNKIHQQAASVAALLLVATAFGPRATAQGAFQLNNGANSASVQAVNGAPVTRSIPAGNTSAFRFVEEGRAPTQLPSSARLELGQLNFATPNRARIFGNAVVVNPANNLLGATFARAQSITITAPTLGIGGQVRLRVSAAATGAGTASASIAGGGGTLVSANSASGGSTFREVTLDYTAALAAGFVANVDATVPANQLGTASGLLGVDYFRLNYVTGPIQGCGSTLSATPVSSSVDAMGQVVELHRFGISGGLPNAFGQIVFNANGASTPFPGGMLPCPFLNPLVSAAVPLDASGAGSIDISFPPATPGSMLHAQGQFIDLSTSALGVTNSLLVTSF